MEPGFDAPTARRRSRLPWLLPLVIVLELVGGHAAAQTPVGLYRSFVGRVNYQATGGSLRSQPNTANACTLVAAGTAPLTGIPAGAVIRAAYLYWGGSGPTIDATVALNGSALAAARTFTATYSLSGTNYRFFSGFADVTPLVTGNGNVTFSGLTVANGNPYCSVQAVVAGWGLIVVYEHASEDLRAVNVFDGFELFRGSSLELTVDRFRIPPVPVNGKVTHISWEGDPQNSGAMSGVSERLAFNGNLLDDGLIPTGSAPAAQQFDGTVSSAGVSTSYGVDVDTYDVSAFLTPGATSATTTYSSGQDLVLLSAEVISFTTEPVVNLSISKTHAGDLVVGSGGSYTIRVGNAGPEPEANPIRVTDTLPAGLTYQAALGVDWSCSAAGQVVDCTHPGPLAVGAALPDLVVAVQAGAAGVPAVTNTATVASASVEADPADNSSSDPTVVHASGAGTKTLYLFDRTSSDPNGFNQGAAPYLSRTPPAAQTDVIVDGNQPPAVWRLTPALQAPLTIGAGSIPVTLYLSKGAAGGGPLPLRLTAALASTGASLGPIGTSVTQTFLAPPSTAPAAFTFDIPLPAATTLAAGTQITLTLTNTTPGSGARRIRVFPRVGAGHSRIDLPALTVIDVDALGTFDAPFPAGAPRMSFAAGASVALRATVSDPFGVFDIASVRLDIIDANDTPVATGVPMTQARLLSGAAASYEFSYTLPIAAAAGTWTYRVTAIEGVEGLIRDTATGTFDVGLPLLTISKSVVTLSDPVNGTVDPKAIPGAVVLYSINVSNPGTVPIDADTLAVRDVLPPGSALYVATGADDPIAFVDGTPPSGLTFSYADAVRFSNQPSGGPPYTYVPTPDPQGFDAAVRGVSIEPQGALAADSGAGAPMFELRYRLRID